MVNLHDIRYLRIGTPRLDEAVDFATRIVGLQLREFRMPDAKPAVRAV